MRTSPFEAQIIEPWIFKSIKHWSIPLITAFPTLILSKYLDFISTDQSQRIVYEFFLYVYFSQFLFIKITKFNSLVLLQEKAFLTMKLLNFQTKKESSLFKRIL